jgi:hypothetical protein
MQEGPEMHINKGMIRQTGLIRGFYTTPDQILTVGQPVKAVGKLLFSPHGPGPHTGDDLPVSGDCGFDLLSLCMEHFARRQAGVVVQHGVDPDRAPLLPIPAGSPRQLGRGRGQRSPAGDGPGAGARLLVVDDTREQPAQFDRGRQLAALLPS